MRRHVPSTRALIVFDAVARHHGVSRAAEELCITHSAVSQQLRQLEAQVGVRLVQRTPRGTELTEAGRRYHAQVAGDLLRLESHTLEAMAQRPGGSGLLLGVVPVLGERWLLPRLAGFTAAQPACSLHVQVFPTRIYMEDPPYDLGIQYDDAVWPGAIAHPLMAEECVVVCAPGSRWREEAGRGDFRRVPLLHLSSRLGAWEEWLGSAARLRAPANPLAGHRFDLFSMLVEAVRADLGLGLVPRYFVQRELDRGELLPAHPHTQRTGRGYSVFVAPHKAGDTLVEAFLAWLRGQVAREGAQAEAEEPLNPPAAPAPRAPRSRRAARASPG